MENFGKPYLDKTKIFGVFDTAIVLPEVGNHYKDVPGWIYAGSL